MKKRVLFLAFVVALSLVLLLFVFGRKKPTENAKERESHDSNIVELTPEAQQNAKLSVVPATATEMTRQIKITGVVSPDEGKIAHISPLGQGVVELVFVHLGDRVQKGQPLLRYDNIELGELISEHLAAHGDLERAKAQQEVARKALERANNLIQIEAVSPRDYELRKAEERQAAAEVTSKEAQLSKVEEKLHRYGLNENQIKQLMSTGSGHRTASDNIIRAPFGGIVIKYDVAQGELVGREKELFTIVDPSNVWVLGDVYEKDLGNVPKKGECFVAVSAYPGVRFPGAIGYVSDFLDPASRTAKLRCVVPNDGRLKLEMFGEVFIPTKDTAAVLSVPAEAVQDINGQAAVFVRKDATHFERREVKLGERNNSVAQILEGVRPGEPVVAEGSFYLKTALLRGSLGEQD